ncbi:MAG: hypothetical protein KGY38_04590 [Desulfobacterales bacterium]|nr:hypothetical protein [Desulfobacterales bacterium]
MNNFETKTKNSISRDHYQASLKEGELVMQPFCACGNPLDEDYFCENCGRRCRCYLIVCRDLPALERVQSYIQRSPQFAVYRAQLSGASSPV